MPLDREANRLRYLVLGIQAEGERRLNAALQAAGTDLTATQSEVLEVLHEEDGLSQTELGRRLVCTLGNVSRLLDRMEAKGLITRAPDPNDRRRTLIHLAGDGRRQYALAEAPIAAILAELRSLYDARELRTLGALLGRLADAFGVSLESRFPDTTTETPKEP